MGSKFLCCFFNAKQCKIAEITSAANSVSNCLKNVFSLIKTNYPTENQNSAVEEVINQCIIISNMFFNGAKSHYYDMDKYHSSLSANLEYDQEYSSRMKASINIMYVCGDSIDSIFENDQKIKKNTVKVWKAGTELHEKYISEKKSMHRYFDDKEDLAIIESYLKKMRNNDEELDLKYKIDTLEKEITLLKDNYNDTFTPYDKDKGKTSMFYLIIGAFLLICSIYLVFDEYSSGFVKFLFGLFGLIGIISICAGFSMLFIKDNKQEREQNRQKFEKELKEKQEMLNELKGTQEKKDKDNSITDKQKQVQLEIKNNDNQVYRQTEIQQNSALYQAINQQNQMTTSSLESSVFQYNQIPNNISTLMNTLGNLKSAKDIYEYLLEFNKYYPNVFNNFIIGKLERIASSEKYYGNQKQDALKILKQYFNIS